MVQQGEARNMERKKVVSSNLRSIGYDASTKTLEVEFVDGGIYQYADVSAQVYAELMAATSHGSYFDAKIKKGGYRFTKMS